MSTYAEIVDAWERARLALGDCDRYTAAKSAADARRFVPYFGGCEADEVRPAQVEDAMLDLLQHGGRNGSGLSKSSLRKSHMYGQKAVEWGIAHGMAAVDVFEQVDRPKGKKSKAAALDAEQAARLASTAEDELRANMAGIVKKKKVDAANTCMLALIALGTGMRRGEILGLQWSDVGQRHVSVNTAVKAGGEVGEPKNATSVRRISVGAHLSELLAGFKAWQSKFRPARGFGEFDPVLCNVDGSRVSPNAVEHRWAEFAEDAGFKGLHLHSLRHTHATLLIAGGVDVKTVQTRLGHASADMMMNVYAHAVPRNDEVAAVRIDGLLGGAR